MGKYTLHLRILSTVFVIMSSLMAETLCMDIGTSRANVIEDTLELEADEDQMQGMLAGFEEKLSKGKKNKQFAEITAHLRNILDRVGNSLSELGISPELPPPQLDKEVWGASNGYAFRPPSACLDGEKETNLEEKKSMWKLIDALDRTAKHRDVILMEIMERLDASGCLTDDGAEAMTMRKQDKEEKASMENMLNALEITEQALQKLKRLGRSLFGEGDDVIDVADSAFIPQDGKTKERPNEKTRSKSIHLKLFPNTARTNALKSIIANKNLPDDVESLQSEYNDEDEEEHNFKLDISDYWKEVANEIRNIVITVHESKMMKKSTKFSIRRALYLFKLLLALMDQRTNELKSKESSIIKTKAELNSVVGKVDHLHREAKNWRNKLTSAQEHNSKLIADLESKENEIKNLQVDVAHHENTAFELKKQINSFGNEKRSEPEKKEAQVSEGKMLDLEEANQKQSSIIEELQEKMRRMALEHTQIMERERVEWFRAREHAAVCEDALKETKMKLKVVEMRSNDFEDELLVKNEQLVRMEREIGTVLTELKAKEEVISKMMGMPESEDPSELIKNRRGSMRRNSRRGSQMAKKKSSGAVMIKTEPEIVDPPPPPTPTPVMERKEGTLLDVPDKAIMKVSSTKILAAKLSRSRANILSVPGPNDDISVPSDQPTAPAKSSTQPNTESRRFSQNGFEAPTVASQRRQSVFYAGERRNSINVLQTKEYKRLASELRTSEKARVEFENEVEELQRELDKQEIEYERALQAAMRQHKMKIYMEEGKNKSETARVYTESLAIEGMINRFKNEIALMFEKSLLTAAARQAKCAYLYKAPTDPENFVLSLKTNNEKYHVAFEVLFESVSTAIMTMQKAQREIKVRSEQMAGMETANHIRVLSEKCAAIEKLSRQVENYREHLNQYKASHHATLKKNLELNRELKVTETEKQKLAAKLKELEDKFVTSIRKTGAVLGKDAKKTKEALEAMLKYSKDQEGKLRQRLLEVSEMLEKEKISKAKLEKALCYQQQQTPQTTIGDSMGITLNYSKKIQPKEKREIDVSPSKAKTNTGRCIQTLKKICDQSEELNETGLNKDLIKRAEQVTNKWYNCCAVRFRMLVKKYLVLYRFKKEQAKASKKVLELSQPYMIPTSTEVKNKRVQDLIAERKKTMATEMKRLQADYWHLEFKKKKLIEDTEKQAEIDVVVKQIRRQVLTVFRSVAKAVIAANRLETNKQQSPQNSKPKAANQDLIVPANSMHSITNNSAQSAVTDASSSPRQPKSANEDLNQIAVRSQSMIIKEKSLKNTNGNQDSLEVSDIDEKNYTEQLDNTENSLADGEGEFKDPETSTNVNKEEEHGELLDNTEALENQNGNTDEITKDVATLTQENGGLPSSVTGPPNANDYKFFARRLSNRDQQRRKSVASTRNNVVTTTWARRASLGAAGKVEVVMELPRAVEIEVRHDLIDMRRGIQGAMRRNSTLVGLNTSSYTISNEGEHGIDPEMLRHIQERRNTEAYLRGLDTNEDSFILDDIVEGVKARENYDDALAFERPNVSPEDSRELPRPSTGLLKKPSVNQRPKIKRPSSVAVTRRRVVKKATSNTLNRRLKHHRSPYDFFRVTSLKK